MDIVGNNWQEQPLPADVKTPYRTVSWEQTPWVRDAEAQTLSPHDLVREVIAAMVRDNLKSKGLPLIACPHTQGLQLENIINGIVDSHRATCTQSKQAHPQNVMKGSIFPHDDEEVYQASLMIEELSRSLQQQQPQQATTSTVKQQKRLRKDEEVGTIPERKKAKRAPKGTVYQCVKCSTIFDMQKDLIKHCKTVHSLTRPFKCGQCDSWFKTNSDCNKHNNTVHLNSYLFYCSICKKGCPSKQKLLYHENTHLKEEDRPYKCKYCNKGFAANKDLEIHVRNHEVEKKKQCELCTAKFVSFNHSYKRHMKMVHLAYVRGESNKCLVCDLEFGEYKQRPLLMEHMKENHSDVGLDCQECGRKFDTESKLLTHEESEHFLRVPLSTHGPDVEDRVHCGLCTAQFVSFNGSYKSHMKLVHRVHIRTDSNKCLECDKEFGIYTQRPLLLEHMKENHSDVGFECQECGWKFHTQSKLITHEQNEHLRVSMAAYEAEKVAICAGDVEMEFLMCKLCGGLFIKKSALDQHMPIHFNNEDALTEEEITTIQDMQHEAAMGGNDSFGDLPSDDSDEEIVSAREGRNTATTSTTTEADSPSPARKSSRIKKESAKKKLVFKEATWSYQSTRISKLGDKSTTKSLDGSSDIQILPVVKKSVTVRHSTVAKTQIRLATGRGQSMSVKSGNKNEKAKTNVNQQLEHTAATKVLSVPSDAKGAFIADANKLAEMIKSGKLKISLKAPETTLQTPLSATEQQRVARSHDPGDSASGTTLLGPRPEKVSITDTDKLAELIGTGKLKLSLTVPTNLQKESSAAMELRDSKTSDQVTSASGTSCVRSETQTAGSSKSGIGKSPPASSKQNIPESLVNKDDASQAASLSSPSDEKATSSSTSDSNVKKPKVQETVVDPKTMADMIQTGKIKIKLSFKPKLDTSSTLLTTAGEVMEPVKPTPVSSICSTKPQSPAGTSKRRPIILTRKKASTTVSPASKAGSSADYPS